MALQPTTIAPSAAGAVQPIPVVLNGRVLESNRLMPLNLDWVEQVRVNTSAVERRALAFLAPAPGECMNSLLSARWWAF